MSTAKEIITELVQKQPDDSSYDEIIRELAFDRVIQRGLKDSDEGRAISNEELRHRINTWLK
jgi:predicted transcriptional regulator